MNILNFQRTLESAFRRHRIIFWYDESGEWRDTFESLDAEIANKLVVDGNEFGTKIRIVRESDRDSKHLLYFPAARPAEEENWLLDLLLQGYEFNPDRAALSAYEAGLPNDYRYLAEEHAGFFKSEGRVAALRDLLVKDDEARDIRLKMMAVQCGSVATTDDILLHFLDKEVQAALIDPVAASFGVAELTVPFWEEVGRLFGYVADEPKLRDFATSLFRGANPLDIQAQLHPHSRVFLQRWKDSQKHCAAFGRWSKQLQSELKIENQLNECGEQAELGQADAFEIFEKFTLHRLCRAFVEGADATDMRAAIQERRASFWWREHEDGYAALEHAALLRELLGGAELMIDTPAAGPSRYTASWWRIDAAYRRCVLHLRRYDQINVMEKVNAWIEGAYVNNFLLPLSDQWSDQVRQMANWECEGLRPQRQFFTTYVQPFLDKGQKVLVIVSDALRYEAAREFAERLRTENRWSAEVEAMLGVLPSYTQLGMAALLPTNELSVDATTQSVSADGRSATGTANRAAILEYSCAGRATALQAEAFLELNSKIEGRALMRDHDVIYVFHNAIDKVGDEKMTEAQTFEAVEKAFDELEQIARKAANINANNMLLTADHGFLFQQTAVDEADTTPLPQAHEWHSRKRRFALGQEITAAPNVKLFSAAALGLVGDWTATFPLSLGRFPLQGSGQRYVHGGVSLQEIIIPVVRLHKARADDTQNVEVELLNVPTRITTGQVSLSLFQDRPAIGKTLPRTLCVGVFAPDGTALSETKTIDFDSSETEARRRESTLLLALSGAADDWNNQEVELRLEETVAGTSQRVIYKTRKLKIQKPFASDFDE